MKLDKNRDASVRTGDQYIKKCALPTELSRIISSLPIPSVFFTLQVSVLLKIPVSCFEK